MLYTCTCIYMYTYNSKNWGWRRPGGVFLAKVLCLWNKQKTFAYFFNIFLMLSNFIYISQTTKLNEKIKHSNTQSRTELFADPIFLLDAHDLVSFICFALWVGVMNISSFFKTLRILFLHKKCLFHNLKNARINRK